jgi:hypothetical protein
MLFGSLAAMAARYQPQQFHHVTSPAALILNLRVPLYEAKNPYSRNIRANLLGPEEASSRSQATNSMR